MRASGVSNQEQSLASVGDGLCVWTFTSNRDLLLNSTYRGTTNSEKSEKFKTVCWNHTNQVNLRQLIISLESMTKLFD